MHSVCLLYLSGLFCVKPCGHKLQAVLALLQRVSAGEDRNRRLMQIKKKKLRQENETEKKEMQGCAEPQRTRSRAMCCAEIGCEGRAYTAVSNGT